MTIRWTEPILNELRQLREIYHMPIEECAERLGIAEVTVRRKVKELKLNGRFNSGRRPGWKGEK